MHVRDVAIHPNGKIFTTDGKQLQNIQIFNDDLTLLYCFSGKNVSELVDIAIDTKGMVYVTDAHKGVVHKFTPEGKHLTTTMVVRERSLISLLRLLASVLTPMTSCMSLTAGNASSWCSPLRESFLDV